MYDHLAWFYDRYWRDRYHAAARPALTRLLYACLPPGSRVLDLCCGTGHLASDLCARGYRVTGIDRSIEMLRLARRSIDAVQFVCADARAFSLSGFDAAVSTFDSINHLVADGDLVAAFRCVAEALRAGGLFVFDVNTEEAYASEWGKSSAVVETDAALFVRGGYDQSTRIGTTLVTMFRLGEDGRWARRDAAVMQRCYSDVDIRAALGAGPFVAIESVSAADAGMYGDIAVGRRFFRCRKR